MTTERFRSPAHIVTPVHPISQRTDRAERDADRAADAVTEGRSVARTSLRRAGMSVTPAIHRQEDAGNKKADDDKKVEALKKTGEALLKTKAGEALKKRLLNEPVVKKVIDAASSPTGWVLGGVAAVGAVTGLALAGKALPMQVPEFPLDVITPGLSGKITATGPLNAPTFVGIAITYREQGPKSQGPKQTRSEKIQGENARLAAELRSFQAGLRYAPGSKEAEEERMTQEAINWVVSRGTRDLGIPGLSGGPGFMLPLVRRENKKEGAPVQRAPASTIEPSIPQAVAVGAVSGTGRSLDERTRRTMESRFGRDFSSVRIHDDTAASRAAASIDAAAFTMGNDIVFGSARFSTSSRDGTHLLAHELAHVVQQADQPPAQSVGDP